MRTRVSKPTESEVASRHVSPDMWTYLIWPLSAVGHVLDGATEELAL